MKPELFIAWKTASVCISSPALTVLVSGPIVTKGNVTKDDYIF